MRSASQGGPSIASLERDLHDSPSKEQLMVKSRADVDTPALIRMHDGEWLDFAEVSGRLKIDGTHSGERFAVADFPHIPPHVLAAPLHRHHNEDEYTYRNLKGRALAFSIVSY
jgi:hypothetical protein